MRGDRQNHTRSPCRPVTHLYSLNHNLSSLLKVLKTKCSHMPRIVTATHVAKISRQERVQEGVPNNCVCCWHGLQFSSLLSAYWLFSHTICLIKKLYSKQPQCKYFKLVEKFLIVVVSQNVFSAEIDNPFFYKVFQLATGDGGFCKEILPWWVVELSIISIACLQRGATLCQSEGTHQIVMSTSTPCFGLM